MRLLAAVFCAALVLGSSAACTKGQDGCVKCDAAGDKCIECDSFWYNDDTGMGTPAYGLTSAGTCVQCQPQGTPDQQKLVARCDGDQPTKAIECSDYEFSDPVYLQADGICNYCSAGPAGKDCAACKDITGECTDCGSYHLNPVTKKCSQCTSDGCISCKNDPHICDDCSGGWYKLRGRCISCKAAGLGRDCTACERKGYKVSCSYCATYDKYGTGLKNGRCVRCLQPGCVSCPTNAAKCESCAWGWRRNDKTGTCSRCPKGCGSCASSPRKCDDCLNDSWKLVAGKCIRKR